MPKISVIVPVYNVEQYLRRCVDSILAQTFTDFELILVNDGSTDNSGDICDEFAKLDQRVVTIHQNNQGVSAARNAGLDISKGEYVTFIDSDDYVKTCFLQNLYANRCDLTVAGIEWVDTNDLVIRLNKYESTKFNNRLEIDFFDLFKGIMMHSPVSKLFHRDIIGKNRFNTNVSWGEDTIFVIDCLKHIRTLIILDLCDYIYVRYDSANTLSTRIRPSLLDDITLAREYCIEFVSSECPNKSSEISDIYTNIIIWLCIGYIQDTLKHKGLTNSKKVDILNVFLSNKYFKIIQSDPTAFLHQTDPLAVALHENTGQNILKKYQHTVLKNKIVSFVHKNMFIKLPVSFQKYIKKVLLNKD